MIDLTPIEVRKKKGDFRRALRGYEPALVDDFLDLAADRLEQLMREHSAQAERLAELERRVSEYRDRERALTDALVTAQEMREEIRAQTVRESEEALKSSTEESEARLLEAEQRSGSLVREAERRSNTLLREAEERSQAMLQEAEQQAQARLQDSEQQAAATVRGAEEGAEETLRRAREEAEAELADAQQEADRLRSDVVHVREREEEALDLVRARQEQHLTSYRLFLERALSELEQLTSSLDLAVVGEGTALAETEADDLEPERSVPRDARAAAAAAVLAQSFLTEKAPAPAEEPLSAEPEMESLSAEPEMEPFEPEPVYEEDLELPEAADDEDRPALAASLDDLVLTELDQEESEQSETEEVAELDEDDADTNILLENAALAGYDLDLGELADEPELLLEEPASENGEDDDDWLSSIIEGEP